MFILSQVHGEGTHEDLDTNKFFVQKLIYLT